ncbi:hypothetical protein L226DRAFT_247961 [Lentinus tigrinus ALCF2SS1-7]|uniref:Uncharacterized protein n=1 Tax=Lentinus tigrinus ALCF2SS1-6 TaxID=1328759 RepID=A0A5C2SNM4_9APHY|nr:hypothetical protein L227DRAFT_205795 [Lentinus tigrinus ALCF2SS1-6]RPD79365.1 hypothetical protein L226DRAFT_247961 [Lentinus tigrinus ALCF2SS1-7]
MIHYTPGVGASRQRSTFKSCQRSVGPEELEARGSTVRVSARTPPRRYAGARAACTSSISVHQEGTSHWPASGPSNEHAGGSPPNAEPRHTSPAAAARTCFLSGVPAWVSWCFPRASSPPPKEAGWRSCLFRRSLEAPLVLVVAGVPLAIPKLLSTRAQLAWTMIRDTRWHDGHDVRCTMHDTRYLRWSLVPSPEPLEA